MFYASLLINDKWTKPQIIPQQAKLAVIISAVRLLFTTLNIITDSQYLAKLVPHISMSLLAPYLDSNLVSLFLALPTLLQCHTLPSSLLIYAAIPRFLDL